MNKIYLKTGAEDIHGSKLNTRIEYILIYKGLSHSVITYGYGKKIYINNKYIKSEPRSNWSRLFLYKEKHSDLGMNTVFFSIILGWVLCLLKAYNNLLLFSINFI